jgi:hypothetical protein
MTGEVRHLELGLEHQVLDGVELGPPVRLRFSGAHEVLAPGPVRLAARPGGSLPGLVRTNVHWAEVTEPGQLRLGFAGGHRLVVEPGWTLTGPGGMRVTSEPDGRLAASVPRVRYFGSLPLGRTRATVAGVVRSTLVDGHRVDEAYTRNLRWEPTTALRDRDAGHDDRDYVELTEAEAEEFIRTATRALGDSR